MEQCRIWNVLASTWHQIKWYFLLMCFVRSWNLGFLANLIAKVLSINKGVEMSCFSYKYSSIFLRHTFSFVSSISSTYFAYIFESTGTRCLCDLQEIIVDPRLIVYPEVDTHVSLPPPESESMYPMSLQYSTLVYWVQSLESPSSTLELFLL